MPVVGSSSTMICGRPTAAMATERRRFMPPEKSAARAERPSRWSDVCTSRSCTSASSSAGGTPLMAPKSRRCCAAVRSPNSAENCGQQPVFACNAAPSSLTLSPKAYLAVDNQQVEK